MTIREMYVNAISALQGNEIECSTDELIQMLTERLEKHDAQNEKRKSADRKPSAKELAAREYDAKLIEAIDEMLTDEFQLRTAFAEALDITPSKASTLLNKMVAAGIVEKAEALDITPSKASTLLNKMVAAGIVEKGEVKGEKGKQVGYKRAA